MSPNIDVGRVINAFQKFSTALVDAQMWKAGKSEGNLARLIFDYVFKGDHSAVTYKPLKRTLVRGNVVVPLTAAMIPDVFNRIRAMELSAENIVAACRDLQAVARLYAEQTIDASKTGLVVIIENLEGLQKVLSISKANIVTILNWNESSVKTVTDDRDIRNRAEKRGGIAINDIFHSLRKKGMELTAMAASHFLAKEQDFPEKTREWIRAIGTPGNMNAIRSVRLLKEMYQSLSQGVMAKKQELAVVLKDDATVKAAIAPAIDAQYDALRSMMRVTLKGFNPVDRIRVALYVTFGYDEKGMRGKSEGLSDFASQLLEEEFFLFVLKLASQESAKELLGNVAQYTEDALEGIRGFEDGEEAEFVFGEIEAEGKYARARSHKLEGRFIVRKNKDGHWVASRKLADLVKVPEADESIIMLMSHGDDYGKVKATDLTPGKEILLVDYHKGIGLKNTVVIDGVPVFRYRNEKDTGVEKMYGLAKGRIIQSFVGMVEYGGKRRKTAFVTMKIEGRTTRSQLDKINLRAPVVVQTKTSRKIKFMDLGF